MVSCTLRARGKIIQVVGWGPGSEEREKRLVLRSQEFRRFYLMGTTGGGGGEFASGGKDGLSFFVYSNKFAENSVMPFILCKLGKKI